MRLAETATVSNSQRLKPPYVGVTADLVIRPRFFRFNGYRQQKFTTELTHSTLLFGSLVWLLLHSKCSILLLQALGKSEFSPRAA